MAKLILWQRRLSLSALCFAFIVIALGALTRLVDAGLGCPDWPGCYGHFSVVAAEHDQQLSVVYPTTPLVSYKAWAEMVHRYCAGMLSTLILGVFVVLLLRFVREKKAGLLALASGLLALVIYQIMLGRWTVTLQLLPNIVTQHLLGGFLISVILALCYISTYHRDEQTATSTGCFILALVGTVLLFIQIFLGAWTSTHYAALSCTGFPSCSEVMDSALVTYPWQEAFQWSTPPGLNYEGGVLSEGARRAIQMTHRIGAAVVFIYWFISFLFISYRLAPKAFKTFYVILLLLLVQIALGIANVVFALPLVVAILHNLTALLLLLSAVFLAWQLVPSNKVKS